MRLKVNIETQIKIKEGNKMNKQLKDTIELMQSEDFKERFKAEYLQLKIRMEGLSNMLKKYKEGTLPFKPKCSYEILYEQLVHMNNYLNILKERARIEGIELVNSNERERIFRLV